MPLLTDRTRHRETYPRRRSPLDNLVHLPRRGALAQRGDPGRGPPVRKGGAGVLVRQVGLNPFLPLFPVLSFCAIDFLVIDGLLGVDCRDYDVHGPAGPTAFWKSHDGVEKRQPPGGRVLGNGLHALHVPLY